MRIRTAALAVVMAAGLVGGVATAASAAETRLGYTCSFPAGKAPVDVAVAATFPGHAGPGKPFRPTGVTTTVTIPRSALGDLATAATVSATTQLTVRVAQDDGQPADAGWLGDAPATKVPASGGLTLAAPGDVPTVTVTTDGTVVFTASKLDLTLTPDTGAPVEASCTPDAGQRTTLGSVPVGNATATASPTPTGAPTPAKPSASGNPTTGPLPKVTGGAATPGVRTPGATPPDTLAKTLDMPAYEKCADPSTYFPFNFRVAAYLSGYANVQKVNGAAVVGYPDLSVARSAVDEGQKQTSVNIGDGRYFCTLVTIELDNGGERTFAPVTTTAPAFGFVPVTATAHISQVGADPLKAVVYQRQGLAANPSAWDRSAPYTLVTTAQVSMRLSGVKVNGVPLDVGANCHTSRPLYTPDSPVDPGDDHIVTVGGDTVDDPAPIYSTPLYGGAQAGSVTIPSFTGCVTPSGDDLDKLLSATVSGPDNYSKIIQGPLCPGLTICHGQDLNPVQQSNWTLTHGGSFDGSGPVTFTLDTSKQAGTTGGHPHEDITCSGAAMSGTAYDSSGPPRGDQAVMKWDGIRGCRDATTGDAWTITQTRSASLDGVLYDAPTGTTKGRGITGFTMRRTNGQQCSVTLNGAVGVTYANSSGALTTLDVATLGTGERLRVTASTCDDFPALSGAGDSQFFSWGAIKSTYTLPPDQAFTLTNP